MLFNKKQAILLQSHFAIAWWRFSGDRIPDKVRLAQYPAHK
ncbi:MULTISPECIES: hypothetical protein [Nostocales]|nr:MULTISPECIES: hypothetical protein [Nostocales]